MKTAREIAEWYAPSAVDALERDILRHMEFHMTRAAAVEREACAKIAEGALMEVYSAGAQRVAQSIAADIRAR